MSFVRAARPALFLAVGLSMSVPALAWGDAAVAAWTARNQAFADAVARPMDPAAPPTASGQRAFYVVDSRGFMYKPNAEERAAGDASGAYLVAIRETCSGLTGEHIKNGGRNMPTWAQTAQGRFCGGVKALEGALVDKPSDKSRCKELKSAIAYAGKARPGEDPEAVVASAAMLAAAAKTLLEMPVVMTQKGRILGDGVRTFSCD